MSLEGIDVSGELVLDGVEVSLGGIDKVSSVLLGFVSEVSDSLVECRMLNKFCAKRLVVKD